eukprot:1159404-Pelagomonas_calceolata.AAC.14
MQTLHQLEASRSRCHGFMQACKLGPIGTLVKDLKSARGPELLALASVPAVLAVQGCWGGWASGPGFQLVAKLPLVIFLTDFTIDLVRESFQKVLQQKGWPGLERRSRHPYDTPPFLRALATFYATTIKYASEFGKLKGHFDRHGVMGLLGRLCLCFDWFGGMHKLIPRKEVAWQLVRCYAYAAAVLSLINAWYPAAMIGFLSVGKVECVVMYRGVGLDWFTFKTVETSAKDSVLQDEAVDLLLLLSKLMPISTDTQLKGR